MQVELLEGHFGLDFEGASFWLCKTRMGRPTPKAHPRTQRRRAAGRLPHKSSESEATRYTIRGASTLLDPVSYVARADEWMGQLCDPEDAPTHTEPAHSGVTPPQIDLQVPTHTAQARSGATPT